MIEEAGIPEDMNEVTFSMATCSNNKPPKYSTQSKTNISGNRNSYQLPQTIAKSAFVEEYE